MHEWKEIRALRLEALKNEPHAFKKCYQEEVVLTEENWKEKIINSSRLNRDEFFIIAKVNNKIIGIVGAEKKENDTWVLKEVYVQKEYRGKNFGSGLLEAIIWKLDHIHHAQIIKLKVNSKQEAAINLYKKCGFIVETVLENQESGDGNRYTKFVMYRNKCLLNTTSSMYMSMML